MNYSKIYGVIIENARGSPRNRKLGYFEKHHIIPKCLGGDNSKGNLVFLTAKEHYVCHHILTKMYGASKLQFAFWAMSNQLGGDVVREYRITSSTYHHARKRFAVENSKLHSGKTLSCSHIAAIKKHMLNRPGMPKGSDSQLYKVKRTDDIKLKISKTKLDNPERNIAYVGDYVTPVGVFKSATMAAHALNISVNLVYRRCKQSNTIINKHHLAQNTSFSLSDLGKTFSELGFGFNIKSGEVRANEGI